MVHKPLLVLVDGAVGHLSSLDTADDRIDGASDLALQGEHHVGATSLAGLGPFDASLVDSPEISLIALPLSGNHAVNSGAELL